MQNEIAVKGDAGQVVAGNATHDGATASTYMSSVITIHPPDHVPPEEEMNRGKHCVRYMPAARQFDRIRWWLAAVCTLLPAAFGIAIYALMTLDTAPGVCHHESRTYSPGSIARMADDQFYVCTMVPSTSIVRWELASTATKWNVTLQSAEPR